MNHNQTIKEKVLQENMYSSQHDDVSKRQILLLQLIQTDIEPKFDNIES